MPPVVSHAGQRVAGHPRRAATGSSVVMRDLPDPLVDAGDVVEQDRAVEVAR
jgi:hypothetical protein